MQCEYCTHPTENADGACDVCLDLRWVTCFTCGKPALGENAKRPPGRRSIRRIVVHIAGRPRCDKCVREGERWAKELPKFTRDVNILVKSP